ncbi:Transmembrane transcriptional regulator (anti-sigma factor RsiW) [Pseudomonas delhiensis]|uniref:Transmembrane transcriptional regulator (Anti-sigma factor RsiW) n=1 Tax=Pseudomonas delhiensis TaxID=366289 RepID=A0A239JZU5_9PSED|nr:anti-sigma factor [Pseudomonas delhiensis]SDI98129.1 Transmembrane transcriptional regulator (anti-sigma factor RsiW) [Pseudomonas delhiensis]SNT11139.1 Transmembrane transcriptional regulator (anti-sigma factor RsiW) [Pseudomonas delhiensis]
MSELTPTESDLHAYVDGQLDAERRQWIEAWLASHPQDARRVEGWKQDAQHLRAALASRPLPPAGAALDPAHIRRRLRERRHARLAVAAALLVALGVGSLGGWQAREMSLVRHGKPMEDAVQAYRLFAANGSSAPLDTRAGENVRNWLGRYLENASLPSDLDRLGLRTVGARLLATEQGAAALVIYEDAQGHRLSFFIRPPGPGHLLLPHGQRQDGELLTRYWSQGDYNYALVSRSDNPQGDQVGQLLGF